MWSDPQSVLVVEAHSGCFLGRVFARCAVRSAFTGHKNITFMVSSIASEHFLTNTSQLNIIDSQY